MTFFSARRRLAVCVVPVLAAFGASSLGAFPFSSPFSFSEAFSLPAAFAADDPVTVEARAHYDRAVQLYKEGAYDAALVEFERAYKIIPNFRILYNMGQVQFELNHFGASLKLLRRYLAEGTDFPPGRKEEVQARITQLELRVANITVVVDVPGAVVSVDDLVVGKSPLAEPILVDIGYRRISATKDGKTDSNVVTVAGGDKLSVQLAVAPAEVQKPIVDDSMAKKPVETKGSFPIVPWVVTGVLAASAVTFGVLTIGKQKSLADERDNPNASRDTLDSKLKSEKTFALTTDILTAGAVVMGGISLYLTFSKPSKPSKPSDEKSGGANVNVNVGVGPGSIIVMGSF